MLRYLALLWDPADATAMTTAGELSHRLLANNDDWQPTLSSGGLSILTARSPFPGYALHKLGDGSAVLGILFDRHDPSRTSARAPSGFFDDDESAKILGTHGRRLVEHYWGRYVAFLSDPGGICKRVL